MSNKLFNILRTTGWLIPLLAAFYCIVAGAVDLGGADAVQKIAAGYAVLVNGIVEKARHDYTAKETPDASEDIEE